jgi:hypothetical protein
VCPQKTKPEGWTMSTETINSGDQPLVNVFQQALEASLSLKRMGVTTDTPLINQAQIDANASALEAQYQATVGYAAAPVAEIQNPANVAADDGAQQQTITEADVEAIISEISAQCLAAGVPAGEIEALKQSLRGSIGAPIDHLGEMREQATQTVAKLVADAQGNNGPANQGKQEKLDDLLADLDENDKKIRENSKAVDHYMTDGQKDRLGELEAEVDKAKNAAEEAKATHDKDKILAAQEALKDTYEELYAYRADLFPSILEQAYAKGDSDSAKSITSLMQENDKGIAELENYKKSKDIQKEKSAAIEEMNSKEITVKGQTLPASQDDILSMLDEPAPSQEKSQQQTVTEMDLGNLSPSVGGAAAKSDLGKGR